MTSQTFQQCCLVLHITGFTMMAGAIITDFSIHRRLNRHIGRDNPTAIIMLDTTAGLPVLISIGALLLVASGIGMVVIFQAAVTTMLWFRIKMILVVSILVNGGLVPRKNAAKLRRCLVKNEGGNDSQIDVLTGRMNIFHAVQLALFLIIFVLSIFRF